MEAENIAHLQAELARLNQLLKNLIVETAEMKADIAHLKSYIGNPERDIAHVKSYIGNPKENIAHAKSYIGNSEANIAHTKSYIGNSEESIAHLKSYVGNPEANIAHPKSYIGNSEVNIAHPKSYVGNIESHTPLPEIITEQSGIRQKLVNYLISQKVARSNRQAIKASAQLIIHIYNKKPCSYPELKKVTGLSQFGVAKRISALKKSGFIKSNGFQNFALTAHTQQILQQIVKQ